MGMLSTKELDEVKEYLLRELPRVLQQDPRFVGMIEGVVRDLVPTHPEFARVLNEISLLRREIFERLDRQERRLGALESDTSVLKQDVSVLKQDVSVLKQDVSVLKQDVSVLKQDVSVLKQDVSVLKQDVSVLKQDVSVLKQDVSVLKQDVSVLKQDVSVLKQDVSVLKQDVSVLKQDMIEVKGDIRGLKRDVAKLQSGQEYLIKRMDRTDAWMQAIHGKDGSDKGTYLEDTFATALQFGLRNFHLSPANIQLRVKLVDKTGLVYKPGTIREVDIVVVNGETIIFEIKATTEIDQVDIFAMKVKLYRLLYPEQRARGIIFSMVTDAIVRNQCEVEGIELIEPLAVPVE